MPTTLKLTAHQSLEDRVLAMHKDGFVYFPNYLGKEEIRELRQAMEHLTPITESFDKEPVSYTHLTLPTILLV